MKTIRRDARDIPVRDEVDVLVCGGGLGGVSAAMSAARAGARTLLVERNSFLGGVATAGMCCSVFNCCYTGGAERRLGTMGVAIEVTDALAESAGYGRKWHKHKGHVIYDVERAKLVLGELVEGTGARMLLAELTSDVVMEGDTLRGVVVESKRGPEVVLAKCVVDATGDADVAARAGAPMHVYEKGLHSLCFRLANVDVDAFVDYFRRNPDQFPEHMDVDWTLAEALAQYEECGTFLFPHGGGMQMEAFKRAKASGELPARVGIQDTTDACQMHALRSTGTVHVVTGFTHFDGLDAEMISRSIIDGRRMAYTVAQVYRKHIPGFGKAFIADTGTNLGVRVSRYLDGEFVLTPDMMKAGVRQPDCVGRAVGWDNVVKHPDKAAWAVQQCREDSFDLPYRCLIPRRVEGLIMGAGRSLSVKDPYMLRVMIHTMVAGQAAGTAAAVAVREGTTPRRVEIAAVKQELRRQGVEC